MWRAVSLVYVLRAVLCVCEERERERGRGVTWGAQGKNTKEKKKRLLWIWKICYHPLLYRNIMKNDFALQAKFDVWLLLNHQPSQHCSIAGQSQNGPLNWWRCAAAPWIKHICVSKIRCARSLIVVNLMPSSSMIYCNQQHHIDWRRRRIKQINPNRLLHVLNVIDCVRKCQIKKTHV